MSDADDTVIGDDLIPEPVPSVSDWIAAGKRFSEPMGAVERERDWALEQLSALREAARKLISALHQFRLAGVGGPTVADAVELNGAVARLRGLLGPETGAPVTEAPR